MRKTEKTRITILKHIFAMYAHKTVRKIPKIHPNCPIGLSHSVSLLLSDPSCIFEVMNAAADTH
jgi:hypothetical protein